MNREEKEMAIALGIPAAILTVLCVLSFGKCIVVSIFALAVGLYAAAWAFFGKLLGEAVKRQETESQQRSACVGAN
jgi:hypothetical protein